MPRLRFVIALVVGLPVMGGCSLLGTSDKLQPAGSSYGASLQPSVEAMAFQKTQQAASLNAAVIQFEGDKSGPKLLKLPPPGQPVYLAGLLEQIDATSNGKIAVTVWRSTPDAPSGAKLAVRFKRNGKVDPLTDYAILPGDRISISPANEDLLDQLF